MFEHIVGSRYPFSPMLILLDAQRTIQLWEEAGASVLHLEDQVMPKKCGHFAGKGIDLFRGDVSEIACDARWAP